MYGHERSTCRVDLINVAALIETDAAQVRWNLRRFEPRVLAGKRGDYGVCIDPEMRDGARIDANHEDTRLHTAHDNADTGVSEPPA